MLLGFAFLLGPLLWALPLAGLPVLLHLLFHRKSPVVPFSTLRFIKSSIQETAARRRIQKWVLLACRILLLVLLIWAMAQPVRLLTTAWLNSGRTTVAAIVADTSYSMLLKQQELTQLDRSGDIINELLRGPLQSAGVAVLRSGGDSSGNPEQFKTAAQIQSEWTALKPQAARRPLGERIAAAMGLLSGQVADQKWLVVLTDLQSREFPAPIPPPEAGTRVILFDLHPENPNSHGITSIGIKPRQPIAGVGANVDVEMTGQAGDAPFANLKITRLDGTLLFDVPNVQATFGSSGRAQIHIPLPEGLPFERWVVLTAQIPKDDDLMWDNSRSQLVELPPKQEVTFIDAPTQPEASRFIDLALDPYQDPARPWPLRVKTQKDLTGQEQVVVYPITRWPSQEQLGRIVSFVKAGNTAVILLQPGLEQSFNGLSAEQKSLLGGILPSTPVASLAGGGSAGVGLFRPVTPSKADPILDDVADPSMHLEQCTIRRFVPFSPPTEPGVSTLVYLSPKDADSRVGSFGLYYRRAVGAGVVYTFATLPDRRYVNPPTHPFFPIQLIKSCLPSAGSGQAQNVEIGQPLVLAGGRLAGVEEMEIQAPGDVRYRVKKEDGLFTFKGTSEAGLYLWRKPGQDEVLAAANVQLPSAESDLIYRGAQTVVPAGENVVVVHSYSELVSHLAQLERPQPEWTVPLAIVLVLMCMEAMLGSLAHLWKGSGGVLAISDGS